MCAKVERITAKTGCTSCTNWTISFKSTRVSDENPSVTKTFHFSKLISTQDFFWIQHATFKATYWNFNPFWLHLLFFMHLMIYFQLNDLETGKGYNLNSEKVETWHAIIIWPTQHVCKSWEHYGKNWMHFVYKLDRLIPKYKGFTRKLICYKDISFFYTYFNSRHFLHSICTIQSQILKFQPFLTSFAFFTHLMIYFELNNLVIRKHYNWTQKRL